MIPQIGILHTHGIDMTVHEDGRSLPVAEYAADDTAIGENMYGLLDEGSRFFLEP
jgi:hypothetical protein